MRFQSILAANANNTINSMNAINMSNNTQYTILNTQY